eukprot:6202732-Pleurochrysis_carterae.AAC.1
MAMEGVHMNVVTFCAVWGGYVSTVGWVLHDVVSAGRMRGPQEQARATNELVGSGELGTMTIGYVAHTEGFVSGPEYWGAAVWGRAGPE